MIPACSPCLEVSTSALAANFHTLAERRPGATVAASVKADAYGLGLEGVIPALRKAGCRDYFTATPQEGIALRDLLDQCDMADARIAIFNGPCGMDLAPFLEARLTPVLNTLEQIAAWRGTGQPAMLHADTGMNRLGLTAPELAQICTEPAIFRTLEISHILSHFSSASDPDHPANHRQIESFNEIFARLSEVWPDAKPSLSASAGLFLDENIRELMIRPGIALYGAGPQDKPEPTLETVARLTAPVLQSRTLTKGECAGYGGTFTASEDMPLATIGIGYGDGLLRSLSNRGTVIIEGTPCPIVGRVSMDLVTVDCRPLGYTPQTGTRAELFGPALPVETVAEAAGTISYEILVRLGARVTRLYTDEPLRK